ncbi:MAG: TIGR02466 family protein [Pseudomonadota bacterium]
MERLHLFPTPVIRTTLTDADLINVYLSSRLISLRTQERRGISPSRQSKGGWHSHDALHEESGFTMFADALRQKVENSLTAEEQATPLWLSALWANICDRFGYDKEMHANRGVWRGLYFVRAPEKSGRPIFSDPRTQCEQPNTDKSGPNTLKHAIDVDAGDILLFPAWLPYDIEANRCEYAGEEGERITLRFVFSKSQR